MLDVYVEPPSAWLDGSPSEKSRVGVMIDTLFKQLMNGSVMSQKQCKNLLNQLQATRGWEGYTESYMAAALIHFRWAEAQCQENGTALTKDHGVDCMLLAGKSWYEREPVDASRSSGFCKAEELRSACGPYLEIVYRYYPKSEQVA